MSATLDYHYRYKYASVLDSRPAGKSLRLSTFGGLEANPYFFDGQFKSPKQSADILLLLSALSRTRFYSPAMIREKMLAAADPVVTCDGSMLRFEVFSVCCGIYARFDLSGQSIDGNWMSKGTTNVDFNPPMRASLSTISSSDKVRLKVGTDAVQLETEQKAVVERKVKLPIRWLRSFVEVQSYQSECQPVMEVDPKELNRLLASIPEHNILKRGDINYIVPNVSGKSLRLSQREAPASVAIGAIGRLKAIQPLLRMAQSVKIYASGSKVCAFEFSLSNGKFHLVLSPDASRAFSGEGQVLKDLSNRVSDNALAKVRAALGWQNTISAKELSRKLDLPIEQVDNALSILGSRGLVGYDMAYGQYFHRELPFDLSLVEELHPRLEKARRLVQESAVKLLKAQGDETIISARVSGDNGEHLVRLSEEFFQCTCDWFTKYSGQRGPCSHVLAVELATQQ